MYGIIFPSFSCRIGISRCLQEHPRLGVIPLCILFPRDTPLGLEPSLIRRPRHPLCCLRHHTRPPRHHSSSSAFRCPRPPTHLCQHLCFFSGVDHTSPDCGWLPSSFLDGAQGVPHLAQAKGVATAPPRNIRYRPQGPLTHLCQHLRLFREPNPHQCCREQ